ncbi:MAG: hypothetical protein BWY76_01229 [bacterium ADurb.Bin429]|nr:MAG: hypothetical protein BWY76_01229 [bacterium ADurb.Bin429]
MTIRLLCGLLLSALLLPALAFEKTITLKIIPAGASRLIWCSMTRG